jgi:hypothetical protein
MLALFVALGGTTYAASTALIGKNTVASPQVVNGSLQTKDLSVKARRALKGNRGPRGLAGAQGAPGAKGATGAQGLQGLKGDPGAGAIAWGYINADGTVSKASSNIASTWNAGSLRYDITISGESYFFSSYVTVVSPAGSTALVPATDSSGGKLLIYFKNLSGTQVQTPVGFQFATYKP